MCPCPQLSSGESNLNRLNESQLRGFILQFERCRQCAVDVIFMSDGRSEGDEHIGSLPSNCQLAKITLISFKNGLHATNEFIKFFPCVLIIVIINACKLHKQRNSLAQLCQEFNLFIFYSAINRCVDPLARHFIIQGWYLEPRVWLGHFCFLPNDSKPTAFRSLPPRKHIHFFFKSL